MSADASADEQLAATMLKGRMLDDVNIDEGTELFPGLLLVNQDKAHASRRLVSGRWACDPVLKELMDMILHKRSVVQRIQHSELFAQAWSDNICNLENHPVDGKRMRDLRSRKHRFESHQRPFGRACLFLVPLVQTAAQIARGRSGNKEAKDAQNFLRQMCAERRFCLRQWQTQATRLCPSPGEWTQSILTWLQFRSKALNTCLESMHCLLMGFAG